MAVISSASMSLDGYIAYPDDSVGALFDWYGNGSVEVSSADPDMTSSMTPQSAAYWREWTDRVGALVVGRTLFDYTDGWHGQHPLGVPVVVLTHEPPTDWSYPGSEHTHFVSDGIAAAVERATEFADGKDVAVAAGTMAGQALRAGLLEYAAIDLVPVVLGGGKRYFADLDGFPEAVLKDPVTTIQGERVTHLVFPVEPA